MRFMEAFTKGAVALGQVGTLLNMYCPSNDSGPPHVRLPGVDEICSSWGRAVDTVFSTTRDALFYREGSSFMDGAVFNGTSRSPVGDGGGSSIPAYINSRGSRKLIIAYRRPATASTKDTIVAPAFDMVVYSPWSLPPPPCLVCGGLSGPSPLAVDIGPTMSCIEDAVECPAMFIKLDEQFDAGASDVWPASIANDIVTEVKDFVKKVESVRIFGLQGLRSIQSVVVSAARRYLKDARDVWSHVDIAGWARSKHAQFVEFVEFVVVAAYGARRDIKCGIGVLCCLGSYVVFWVALRACRLFIRVLGRPRLPRGASGAVLVTDKDGKLLSMTVTLSGSVTYEEVSLDEQVLDSDTVDADILEVNDDNVDADANTPSSSTSSRPVRVWDPSMRVSTSGPRTSRRGEKKAQRAKKKSKSKSKKKDG